jgi:hypothetical protein
VNCRPSQTELDGFRYRPRRKLGRFVGGSKCRIVDGNWIRKQNAMVGTGRFELPTRKAEQIVGATTGSKLTRFRLGIVRNYISGDIVLKQLEQDLPETFKYVKELKDQKEADLDTETTTSNQVPSNVFNETLQSYQAQLSKTPGLSERTMRSIANEAIADWLLRCPLEP